MTERDFVPSRFHLNLYQRTRRALEYAGGNFTLWQSRLRAKLYEIIGGFPEPPDRVPLEPGIESRTEKDGYIQERIVFRSEPFCDVPAYLLLPEKFQGRLPVMICLQGHSPGVHISIGEPRNADEAKSVAGGRDFAVQAVKRGYAALALEQRLFGERRETEQRQRSDHGCFDATMHSLLLGRTTIGERVFDVVRAMEYLSTRPEIDMDRIGCMGNSGGGTVTFYAGCLLDQIKVVVPSCSFCTYWDSLMRIYHCSDNYPPGILQWAETGDLAGLIAPRHFVAVAGVEDGIFPIAGVRRAFERARELFETAGCPDRAVLVEGPEGHRFYPDQAWPEIQNRL